MVPRYPEVDGRFGQPPHFAGREQAIDLFRKAGGDRVHMFDVENVSGTAVYVHAKVCVIDDVWVSVGSDNFNRRSWTHDSELSNGVLDATAMRRTARSPDAVTAAGVRARPPAGAVAEHLFRAMDVIGDGDLLDPVELLLRSSGPRPLDGYAGDTSSPPSRRTERIDPSGSSPARIGRCRLSRVPRPHGRPWRERSAAAVITASSNAGTATTAFRQAPSSSSTSSSSL